jgi:hypothetical protein
VINSVPALCRMLSKALQSDVLPHLEDTFARGQLFAVIYVLNNLERQADWSSEQLATDVEQTQSAVRVAKQALVASGTPIGELPSATQPADSTLKARRDAANLEMCALLGWFASQAGSSTARPHLAQIESILIEHAAKIVDEQRRRVAPSMMKEMSGAVDQ